jgi:hypothetical protein
VLHDCDVPLLMRNQSQWRRKGTWSDVYKYRPLPSRPIVLPNMNNDWHQVWRQARFSDRTTVWVLCKRKKRNRKRDICKQSHLWQLPGKSEMAQNSLIIAENIVEYISIMPFQLHEIFFSARFARSTIEIHVTSKLVLTTQ